MTKSRFNPSRPLIHHRLSLATTPRLIAYSLIILLISLGDAIVTYVNPVYIEAHLGSALWMGLILSSSSVFGIIFDFVGGQRFRQTRYSFFLWWMFLGAIIFPLTFLLLPPWILVFVLGMAIWGIYFELLQFANFHFIHDSVKKEKHAFAWGILTAFKSLAYMLGPLLAGILLVNFKLPFLGALAFFLIGLFAFIFFQAVFPQRQPHRLHLFQRQPPKKSFIQELNTWKILISRIEPILLFLFSLSVIEATFWSVGALLSEQLRHLHPLGSLFLVIHMLPSLFVSLLASKFARPWGKKRAAFVAGIFCSLGLFAAGLVSSISVLIGLVFFSSIFSAIAWPEILAVFEDFVARLGKTSNDMIALQSSAVSLSYIIGPILAGIIATFVGYQQTFSVMGIFLLLVSLFALLKVPRKIHLPQAKLDGVSENKS